jgi:hypothetical protein
MTAVADPSFRTAEWLDLEDLDTVEPPALMVRRVVV